MGKIGEIIKFYFRKVVDIIDSFINNAIKTIEAVLSKIPKAIDDLYGIIISNLNIKSLIILVLLYILFINAKVILANVWQLIIILVAILALEGSSKNLLGK